MFWVTSHQGDEEAISRATAAGHPAWHHDGSVVRAHWLTEARPCTPRIVGRLPCYTSTCNAFRVMPDIYLMTINRSALCHTAESQPETLRVSGNWDQQTDRAASVPTSSGQNSITFETGRRRRHACVAGGHHAEGTARTDLSSGKCRAALEGCWRCGRCSVVKQHLANTDCTWRRRMGADYEASRDLAVPSRVCSVEDDLAIA